MYGYVRSAKRRPTSSVKPTQNRPEPFPSTPQLFRAGLLYFTPRRVTSQIVMENMGFRYSDHNGAILSETEFSPYRHTMKS
jgi:hypothetical protein